MSFWNSKLIVDNINYLYASGEDISYSRMWRERGYITAAAYRTFGGWKEAVEAAGIDYEKIRKYKVWTNEKIISKIRKRHSENKPLNYRQISLEDSTLLSAATQKKRFGQWDEALKAAGLDPKNVRKYECWDAKRVKTEIRKLFKKGSALNQRTINGVFPRLLAAAGHHFGSWMNAVIATGFKYDKIVLRRKMTRDEILKELKDLRKKGVRLFGTNVSKKYSRLHASATREFGTWTKARQAIGDFSNYRIKWTKETVIKEIRKIHKKGVILTKKHMLKENIGLYCASRYPRNFGSWPEARRAAGIKGYEGIVYQTKKQKKGS